MGIEFGVTSLSTSDRIEFFRTLAGWLTSGGGRMSVAESVQNTCDAFSREEYKTLRRQMERISSEYMSGQTPLYLALHNSNIGFTRQELAILQAAEKSNQMRVAVPALVDALEIQNNGRRQLMSKLTMPLVSGFMLIVLSLGVLIFMLPMVLGPTLERKPEALQSFPFIIRWYWHASLWLKEYWYIPTAILVGIALFILLRNLPFIKPYFQRLLMWFGPTRKLQLAFNSTLVVFFMPALIRSGMTTPQVINTLADCVQNMSIAGLLRAAARDHEAGMKMGQALTILPFKASFTNAVSAGEATGQLAERVQDLQTPYRIELERNIRQTVSTLNFIVMALLLPMFLMSTYTSLVAPIFALMKF